MVVINDIQLYILYFHIHGPRHQQHDHTGKDKNQSRQERIAKQLFKLFFYQKFYHNKFLYSNRYLNFLMLIVISTMAISNKMLISLSPNTTGTPSIISLRTACIYQRAGIMSDMT